MKLVTNNFRTHMAKQFIESITESAPSVYFLGAHRTLPFANDSIIPTPENSDEETFYNLYDELIFGKRITNSDVVHMTRRIDWVSGTTYDMYDSRTADLESKNYFVVSSDDGSTRNVFKCLYNNGGQPSIIKPSLAVTSPEDEIYITADGYQWKYMYSITASQWTKFATPDNIPVFINANVVNAAVDGSIDRIVVEDPGSEYRSYAEGNIAEAAIAGDKLYFAVESDTMTLSGNDNFYDNCMLYITDGPGNGEARIILNYFVNNSQKVVMIDRPFNVIPTRLSKFKITPRVIIQGDGQNAAAFAEVDTLTGSISDIVVVNRGVGYTYADIQVIGNTGSTSASVTSSAIARAIISPPGGHGSDAINELRAGKVGVSVTFDRSEANTIPTSNDYHKISIIKDPLFYLANLTLLDNVSPVSFTPNEIVTQASTGASATVASRTGEVLTLTNIKGFFATGNNKPIVGASSNTSADIDTIDRTFNTFDQRTILQTTIMYDGLSQFDGFASDEIIAQAGLLEIESSVAQLRLETSALAFKLGETITQASTGGSGKVSSRVGNVLSVINLSGYFETGGTITGDVSNSSATIVEFDNTFAATASGVFHSATYGANNSALVALVNVNGTFLESDDTTNTTNTIKGQRSQTIAKVIDVASDQNKLVDGSGEFLYIEHISPITRSDSQKERIKLIVEF